MWTNPLPFALIPCPTDRTSFTSGSTGLPMGAHPGAFGVRRKHHFHEGVDLYAPAGTPVRAVESGAVVAVMAFTGPAAGLPWWLDTSVVLVEGATGVVAYGEIEPAVAVGQELQAGDTVGQVVRVLRNDKGRPTCMLHLELHTHGARATPEWYADSGRPQTLLDPTPYLAELAAVSPMLDPRPGPVDA